MLPPIPTSLWSLMKDIGPRWGSDVPGHVRLMLEQFTPILSGAPKQGVDLTFDVAYGDHPRQRFDIFAPTAGAVPRPAVVFVHGGAFVEGHRNRSKEIYANVLYCLGRHGMVGVNMGYRLAGDAGYPEATRDVATVVAWVHQHSSELGVDPSRVFLMGHSAGAAHAGCYAYDRRHHPSDGPGLAGLIIVSGRMRADNLPENPNARKVEAYYGSDNSVYDDASPVSHVGPGSIPTFVAWSEFENPLIDVYCAELVYKLALAKRRAPPTLWLQHHNHTSAIAHLNTAESRLEQAIVQFIASPF